MNWLSEQLNRLAYRMAEKRRMRARRLLIAAEQEFWASEDAFLQVNGFGFHSVRLAPR